MNYKKLIKVFPLIVLMVIIIIFTAFILFNKPELTVSTTNNDLDYEKLFSDEIERDYAKEMIGAKATDFTYANLNGEQIQLSNLIGKNVVLFIAQPTCSSCSKISTVLEEFKSDNPDIVFIHIFINIKDLKQEEFLQSIDNFYTALNKETDKNIIALTKASSFLDSYSVKGTPTILFIDNEGTIQYTQLGYADRKKIDLMSTLAFGSGNIVKGIFTDETTVEDESVTE